ncbi:MAG: hypothetical protein ACRD29_12915 [Acidimicrobiales bacterium]
MLAGLAAHALTTGGTDAAILAFVVAALSLVVLMFTLALFLAAARERVVDAMQQGAPVVKRWGGRLLVLVGAWLITLGVFADLFAELFPV